MTTEEAIWAMNFYKAKLYNGIFNQYVDAFDVAIAALRAQLERENPEPLTLDELRKMDSFSSPIWDSCLHEWCAVRSDVCARGSVVSYIGGGSRPLEANRFYRYKPKEKSKC